MKISYQWLKDFLSFNLSPEETADILTNVGLEVEGIEYYENIKGGLEGLVVGEVLEKKPHPNADKLSLTKVKTSDETILSIVCGAPNVAQGQKVIVATVGTTLYPIDGEPFKIKKSKIRGEVSEGMICAEDEIGIGNNHDGIIVLPENIPVGTPAVKVFDIYKDTVFEIGLTPNRADAMSHWGVARDLKAVISCKQQKEIPLRLPDVSGFKVDNSDYEIDIIIEDTEACPRYCGVTITGVTVKESPQWLKNKLQAIGVRPINNIVDATNYVLHELGQPLHAFDADKIEGKKVIVKTVAEGTPFITLDGIERKLSAEDLMICDAKKPMTIAGVFGGLNSGVSAQTKNIFLESAYFHPVGIRKTAKRHGLSTDASFRYERGIDPNITRYALKRAVLLIQQIAGGHVSMQIKDTHSEGFPPFQVEFSPQRARTLIGKNISDKEMLKILNSLEIKAQKTDTSIWRLLVPRYRVDVQREADIVEEILRIYGFNEIDIPEKFSFTPGIHPEFDKDKIQNQVSSLFTDNGFFEIMNNSLTSSEYYHSQENNHHDTLVKILNPISSELDVMRQTLLFGGLESIAYNIKRQRKNLKFFEFGKAYFKQANHQYQENALLQLLITGSIYPENWQVSPSPVNLFTLKGYCYLLMQRLGIQKFFIEEKAYSDSYISGLEILVNRQSIVKAGQISSDILQKFDIEQAVYGAEINWSKILEIIKLVKIKYQEPSKYPFVRRDFAFLADKSVSFSDIKQIALKTERKLLREVNLFDVYEGKNLPEGKKSYAVSFVLQSDEKTLSDKQVDKVMEKIRKNIEEQLGITLR